MAHTLFHRISQKFQGGLEEVQERLPLFRSGASNIFKRISEKIVGTEGRPKTLRFFPEEFRKTTERLTAPFRIKDKEEAKRRGAFPIEGRFIEVDPFATGTLKRVGSKIVKKLVSKISKERGFITSVKEAVPEIKVAGQYVPRSTDRLAIKAKNLIKDDIVQAERIAMTGTDDTAVATASELIKQYGELAQKATGPAKISFYDKAAEITTTIAKKLTDQGRSVQAASILGRQTPEGQIRFAARTIQKYNEGVETAVGGLGGLRKKVPELTGRQFRELLDKARKIQSMPQGIGKSIAFKKLQDEISDLIPSSWYKKAINIWKAGLLTGVKTTGLNVSSTLFHGVSEIGKEVPAVAVDKVASLFTKERTIAFTLRGIKEGVPEGFTKGLRYMTTGFDERNIAAKLDWRRVNFGKGKIAKALRTYEEFIFHLMGAEDQPFYYGAKARSIASQAIAQAKTKKLKGIELKKFVDDLMKNPTSDMITNATNDAEIAIFQNQTVLGDLARSIQKIPGGEVVVPFGRTPSAVIMQVFNYSPLGIVKTIVETIGKGRFNQRAFSQGLGRGITGSGIIYIGMQLFKNGLIETDRPKTERERKQWELEGRKANAFKTPDGKWRSALVLGPAGMLLVMGGNLQKAIDSEGSFAAALPQAGAATAKSFTEQTFLTGINQFSKAINDPKRYALPVISRLVGSTIPTIISDVARSADPLERRTGAKTEGFVSPLKSRVPGLRQTLEPRIDVLGYPLLRTGNALETMIDPTRPTKIKSSDLIEELRRLFDAGFSSTPTDFADEKKYTNVLTGEQITSLQEKAGIMLESKLTNLIAHKEYKKLDDDEKMRKIKDFTRQSRVNARAVMIEDILRELPPEEATAKLSEFKKSGFMTRQVFNKWEELFR